MRRFGRALGAALGAALGGHSGNGKTPHAETGQNGGFSRFSMGMIFDYHHFWALMVMIYNPRQGKR
jgi:hypothetical protein